MLMRPVTKTWFASISSRKRRPILRVRKLKKKISFLARSGAAVWIVWECL